MSNSYYAYEVTRIHANEQRLLNKQDIETLIAASDANEVLRLLKEKGWSSSGAGADIEADAMLHEETQKTWDLVQELCGNIAEFAIFRYVNDFHNLKAAIKLTCTEETKNNERYFIPYGNVEASVIMQATAAHDFSELPEYLKTAGQEAYDILVNTGNGQLCDMILDNAALETIWQEGEKTKSKMLQAYVKITVDVANIKAAVRCFRMGKSKEFVERAIANAGTFEKDLLVAAACEGIDEICKLLEQAGYSNGAEALRKSMAAFECWCDNAVIEMIRPQRGNYFGIEPIAAFVLGRENEIRLVRLIISAKINHLENAVLRERLRLTYV